jgi:Recombination endonuclease VII
MTFCKFHPDRKAQARGLCAPCYHTEWESKNKPKRAAAQRRWIQSQKGQDWLHRRRCEKHGITPEEYKQVFERQHGLCGICQQPKPLFIDHCHDTDDFRGLICQQCNAGLGLFGDSVDGLRKALVYLEKYGSDKAGRS